MVDSVSRIVDLELNFCKTFVSYYLLRKSETGNVTPAKAGVYGEKTGFLLSQE